jgi:hypothetical protein
MRGIAVAVAKHAAIFVLAVLAAVEAANVFAIMSMFSDEKEMESFTDTGQWLFAAGAFLTVAVGIYGLWGLVRLCRTAT